jgi:hypothetical protein
MHRSKQRRLNQIVALRSETQEIDCPCECLSCHVTYSDVACASQCEAPMISPHGPHTWVSRRFLNVQDLLLRKCQSVDDAHSEIRRLRFAIDTAIRMEPRTGAAAYLKDILAYNNQYQETRDGSEQKDAEGDAEIQESPAQAGQGSQVGD